MNQEVKTIEFGLKERILQYYFLHRGKVYGWAAGILGSCVLGIAYISSGPSDSDYLLAQSAFQEWKNSPNRAKSEKKMHQSIQRVPGLQRALEAEIAQIYLAHGMIERAESAAQHPLERLKKVSPFHAQFSESSLLIEKGEHQKALELSVNLKEKMEKSLDYSACRRGGSRASDILYLNNLVRIAFLHKQMNNGPGELASWEELKGLLETEGSSHSAAKSLQANFNSKTFSLKDFISLRERLIH